MQTNKLENIPNLGQFDFNSRMVNFVEDGIDFAIRYGELTDSNLIARKLVRRSMLLAASPEYLTQRGTPTHPKQLQQHQCIVANNDHWTFNIDNAQQAIKVPIYWRSNNANVVVNACEQGLGLAYLPEDSFARSIEKGLVQPVLQSYCFTQATSWIVYQNRQFMPLKARLAIDFLIEKVAVMRNSVPL